MKLWRSAVLGYLGGMLYVALELLWRGRSHGSMFVLGGLCFVAVGELGQRRWPRLLQAALGALVITFLELVAGLLVNRDYSIWDYRDQAYNFMGQICLPFSILWMVISLVAIGVYDRLKQALGRLTF